MPFLFLVLRREDALEEVVLSAEGAEGCLVRALAVGLPVSPARGVNLVGTPQGLGLRRLNIVSVWVLLLLLDEGER